MNMTGWTANDCKHTAMMTTMLFSNIVYFLGERENGERGEGEKEREKEREREE